jgi:predicted regulator of Ras-like GTPase activity (Roadblock/LC7/MglB family)
MTDGGARMATEDARNFNWLLNSFVEETAGVHDAVAVSSDGVLLARSSSLDHEAGEQLCAIIAGCTSLARAADQAVDGAGVERVIIAMREGFLFVSAIADGSCLGVVASRDCDVGSVGYQTTELVNRVGTLLTPALRAELQQLASLGLTGPPPPSWRRSRGHAVLSDAGTPAGTRARAACRNRRGRGARSPWRG